ncbi:MAG TPA: dynamin family protein [Coleofasciculaceae cyanobacterium]|jgi:predicted GTPase/NTP pyrophosphatase (non-canonical NTP hydrolase)
MSSKLYKIFEEVEGRAKLLSKYWDNFYTEISQYLPETYQPEMKELSGQLEQALEKLVSELRNPTLTLATTGTTSSGKSTLVNLLCGAEIVPVAVSEMSAGAVTIEYSEKKSLIIHETPGATWECGEWHNIREEEIYQRLHHAMMGYIDSRDRQVNIACPQSVIRYPFRLLKESKLELPQGTKMRIMDLPGLAYVGDEGNASIIRQCREALCIVTYNSAETDPQRVRSLLQEVVEQVKDLGGSPARMLFVLNRIDVFRTDRDWPETENRFVTKTIGNIRSELTEQLKEYTKEIENLQVVKLSTWPALLALQIKVTDDIYSAEACKKADNNFNGLIADILEDLPRNTQKWTGHDRNRVAEALWQKSYAEEFQQNLKEHITQHFPQLVIPQVIERFNIAAGNAIAEWATQTITAILSSSEEHYQKECENVIQIKSDLDHFLQISNEKLRKPFDDIAKKKVSDPNFLLILEGTIKKLQSTEPYNEIGEKLFPLYGWEIALSKCRKGVLEEVISSLRSGKVNLNNPNLKKADGRYVSLLEKNLKRLIDLGYTASVAEDGETRNAVTDEDKKNLKQLNEELGQLSINLSLLMENILEQVADQEIKRMYEAVTELFGCYLDFLEKGASDRAPNLMIKFPKSELSRVQTQLNFKDFNFESGFNITEKTWEEETRSFWHWFGLIPKVETRSSDNAKIPSAVNLLENWTDQAKRAEPEVVKPIVNWLLEQIGQLKKTIDQIQSDVIDRYRARLDKAHQEVTFDYEKQRNIWQPMQQKAKNIAKEFSSLERILKEES